MPDWALMAGGLIGLTGNTLALIIGIARFRKWMQDGVIEPYIKPLREDVSQMKTSEQQRQQQLDQHERYIFLLLGKQFGGVPKLEDLGGESTT